MTERISTLIPALAARSSLPSAFRIPHRSYKFALASWQAVMTSWWRPVCEGDYVSDPGHAYHAARVRAAEQYAGKFSENCQCRAKSYFPDRHASCGITPTLDPPSPPNLPHSGITPGFSVRRHGRHRDMVSDVWTRRCFTHLHLKQQLRPFCNFPHDGSPKSLNCGYSPPKGY